jgi:hypothetical protein
MAPATQPATNIGAHPTNTDQVANERVSDFFQKMAASPYGTTHVKEMALIAKLAGL